MANDNKTGKPFTTLGGLDNPKAFSSLSPTLEDPHEVSIVAGIFGMNPSQVYQMRKAGVLPQTETATYRQVFSAYISHLKNKAAGRDSDAATRSQIQKTLLDEARTEEVWGRVRVTRNQLIDPEMLMDVFEPAFLLLRSTMMELGHKHPEIKAEIRAALEELAVHGESLVLQADTDQENIMQSLLTQADDEMEELAQRQADLNDSGGLSDE